MMFMKKMFSRRFKNKVKYYLSKNQHTYDGYIGLKKAIVCLGADYGNLGDIAITLSQMEFLKEILHGYEVFEFPISSTYTDMKSLRSVVTDEDIITLVGGGNTSERYADIEECRQFIVENFSTNLIISFPQSVELVHASDRFLSGMRKAYLHKPNLHFIAREGYSYEAYRRCFPDKEICLFPDIVFSKKIVPKDLERRYITLSFRKDKEQKLHDAQLDRIKQIVSETGFEIIEKDTQIKEKIKFTREVREDLLEEHLNQYMHSRLVVTDRLHGMILAYITHTPCIVFAGDNPKIEGCYEWISTSDQVVFYETYEEISFKKAVMDALKREPRFDETVNFDDFRAFVKSLV